MSKFLKEEAFRFMNPYRMSSLQRAFLSPYFGLKAAIDPTRGDMIAALGDSLGEPAASRMLKVFSTLLSISNF